MTKGVLLFASNNKSVDYVKQAIFLAKRIRKYMDLPTSIVTDIDIESDVFDYVIHSDDMTKNSTSKRYADGDFSDKTLKFNNKNRASAYEFSLRFYYCNGY